MDGISTFDCEIENDLDVSIWNLMPQQVEIQDNPLIKDKQRNLKSEMLLALHKHNLLTEENEAFLDRFMDQVFNRHVEREERPSHLQSQQVQMNGDNLDAV